MRRRIHLPYCPSDILVGRSQTKYRLVEPASSHHPDVWLATSLRDENSNEDKRYVIKSPFRQDKVEEERAVRQSVNEIRLLSGLLKEVRGLRGVVDLIDGIELDGLDVERDGLVSDGDGEVEVESSDGEAWSVVYDHFEHDLYAFHYQLKRRFERRHLKALARGILEGLGEMHARCVVHTDLKPENIVLRDPGDAGFESGDVRIIDFGVASCSEGDRTRLITNPYWRAPEAWLRLPWGPAADVWSFGAMMASLMLEPGASLFQPPAGYSNLDDEDQERAWLGVVSTMVPFPSRLLDRAEPARRDLVVKAPPKLTPDGMPMTLALVGSIFEVAPEDWKFVTDVLRPDPKDRPTAKELSSHPWLSSTSSVSLSGFFKKMFGARG